MSFDTLGLSDKVVAAVKTAGYTAPTPIQEQAIPHVLERRDVLGLAQTGTGKTASFVLPMLTRLEQGRARARMPRTLILEPTRELAAQVQDNFERYGVNHKLTVALLIGGVSFDEQDKKITRGADVLIATPGRLLDHFERGRLLLTGVEILVIDEADRMLDMGFIPDIDRIVKLLPFTRQTLFFSATMPPEITQLVDRFLHNPVRVEVSKPASVGESITQTLVPSGSKPNEKRATLRHLIKNATDLTNAIIFCNRKRDVATVYRSLERHGFSVGALHGDMDQHARLATLESFRDNRITLLVASDVAARGLDIPAVSHIFNFDVPTHSEDYVHRIGRTGRAGRSGSALTIVTKAEGKYVQGIEKLIGTAIPLAEQPVGLDVSEEDDAPEGGERRSRSPRARGARDEPRTERAGAERGEGRNRGRRGENNDLAAPRETTGAHDSAAPREGRARRRRSDNPDSARAPRPSAEQTPPRTRPEAEAPITHAGPNPARQRPPQDPRSERQNRSDRDDRTGAVGFTDHVPAFLLRPVRLPRETEVSEEV
jgi:superfamily II DNA/RNA helicase